MSVGASPLADPFDRRDRLTDRAGGEDEARADQLAVHEHAARSALPLFARAFRPVEPEPLAQDVEQVLAEPGVLNVMVGAVHAQPVLLAHARHLESPRQQAPGQDVDRVTAVCRGRAVVGDRAAGGGGEATELDHVVGADRAARPVEPLRRERLGLGRPDDRRGDRPEGEPHRTARPIDGQARPRDRDDHRVAHADLGVTLPAVEQRHGHGDDQLSGRERRLLDPDHELADRHRARARGRGDFDGGLERGEHGQAVAGRRARRQVPADRRGVADLRGPDRARRLGQRRQQPGERFGGQLGVGDAGADAQRPCGPVSVQARSSGTRLTDDHREIVADPAVGLVDLDHQVGAAGEHERVRMVAQRTDGVGNGSRDEHRHAR